jgi:hypothetical protein
VTPLAVPAADLDQWAGKIAWHLDQFCASGQWEPGDLLDHIRARDRQLWVVERNGAALCVILTSLQADRLNTVQVTHGAGVNYREWLHLWPVIEAWARDLGAKRIETVCRPGWERVLGRYGMTKTHVVLEKRL